MSGSPNSRFMNELLAIMPTQPCSSRLASAKNCTVNGTVSAYVPLHSFPNFARYILLRALSFAVMYGGLPTTVS